MALFRSEEHVTRWATNTGRSVGAVFSIDALWKLSQLWFHDRLSPEWRRRTMDETHEIFASCGLTGQFWRLDA
jgi:hypothetical protein